MQSHNSSREAQSNTRITQAPVIRWASGSAIVILTAAGLFAGGFASDLALAQRGMCIHQEDSADPFIYAGSAVVLAIVFWIASRLVPGHTWRRVVAKWLIAISSAGIVAFVLVALLSLGFATSARDQGSVEIAGLGILLVLTFAGQSIAALSASILVLVSGTRAMSTVVPASVFLIVTAISAAVPLIVSAVSCS